MKSWMPMRLRVTSRSPANAVDGSPEPAPITASAAPPLAARNVLRVSTCWPAISLDPLEFAVR